MPLSGSALKTPGHQCSSSNSNLESLAKAALAEALSWADTLDQHFGQWPEGEPRPGKKVRKALRQSPWALELDEDAHDLVEAFQYARKVVHHRWLDLISVRMCADRNRQVNLWVWAPLPDNKRPGDERSRELDTLYARKLEGRPLLETLDEARGRVLAEAGSSIERAALDNRATRSYRR